MAASPLMPMYFKLCESLRTNLSGTRDERDGSEGDG